MNQKVIKTLVLVLILNLVSIRLCFGRNVGQFCDNSFVDAVLWDGISYRLTRNEWIATYDSQKRNVDPFVHLSDDSFQNEKGYYYQSVYNIPTVPKCNETTISCELMNDLKGLTVYVIRRYRSVERDSYDVIHRIYRNGNMRPDHKVEDIKIQTFLESNLLPKRSLQKYRPSVYSPKDFTFIHITNQYQNFGPLLETIQLKTNGVIERSYHELNEFKDIVFITSFWWTFTQKLYIIGEHKTGFGIPFIYEMKLMSNDILLKPINKSVLEFFGCDKPKENRLVTIIKNKISANDLGQWSVQTINTTTPQYKAMNEMTDQRAKQMTRSDNYEMRSTVRSLPVSQQTTVIDPNYQISGHRMDQTLDYRTNQRIDSRTQYESTKYTARIAKTEQVRQYVPTQSPGPRTDTTAAQRTELWTKHRSNYQKTDQTIDQIFNRTASVVIPSTIRVPVQSDQTTPMTPAITSLAGTNKLQNYPQNLVQKQPDINEEINVTSVKMDMVQMKKYTTLKVSDFWKIFPLIVMITLFLMSILMITVGSFAVLNLTKILKSKVRQTKSMKAFNELKNRRMKYDDELNDFFIEEYDTSPKRISSVDNNSCQTNESFDTGECDRGKDNDKILNKPVVVVSPQVSSAESN